MRVNRFVLFAVVWCLMIMAAQAGDWSEWRGPTRDNHAAPGQKPPLEWADDKNVRWKSQVPGMGHSTPVVSGERIILTTADLEAQTQSVLAYDRASGQQLWETVVHRGDLPEKIHKKNTHASSTVVCQGQRIFALFFNGVSVYLTALDMAGAQVWQKKVGEFHSRYPFGFGSSPISYGSNIIVVAEYEGGGYLAAFSQKDGSEQWRTPRQIGTSYSTPVIAEITGREQLLISGQSRVSSYAPDTGEPLWHVQGSSPATCGTMVWHEDIVFASGGYPNKETIAVRADGSGEILWKNGVKCYEQSMLVVDGYLYGYSDTGIMHCWDCMTGEEQWKTRLGGPVSASPVNAGRHIYATNEQGTTFVFAPTPEGFKELARNQLGEVGFATPTFVDSQVFIRTATYQGEKRQEWLYRLGAE